MIHHQPTLTNSLINLALLHDAHLSGNLDTTKRAMTRVITRLDINRIHIEILVCILAEELGVLTL
jgi:hypothetical protein